MTGFWHRLTCPVCNPVATARRKRALAAVESHAWTVWAATLNAPRRRTP